MMIHTRLLPYKRRARIGREAAEMRRKRFGLIPLFTALLCLCGCAFSSPEELYAVPKAAEDYRNLQDQIDKVRSAGAEYAGPLFGTNTQPVQLMDLDGDGIQEAIAFFRATSADDPDPLKIYIYHQMEDGAYEVWSIIEGDAPAINSISYEDLDGKTGPSGHMDKELVVSWRLSYKIYRLEAFSVTGQEVETLLPAVSYTDYVLWDMDKDNQREIVMITLNTVDSVYQADYYDYQAGQMVLRSSAPLSGKITGLASNTKPLASYLCSNGVAEPAVFVTSNLITGVITDIFTWQNNKLVNITLNPTTGMSDDTFRLNTSISIQDINDDGYPEVPRPNALPTPDAVSSLDFWQVQWLQYDLKGKPTVVSTTYYNGEDGWYLVMPESWQGKVALSRLDNTGSGERGVLFYPYSAEQGEGGAALRPFLSVYKLTGPNRKTRANAEGRFILLEEDDVIYAAELHADSGWDCGVDQEGLKELFHLI